VPLLLTATGDTPIVATGLREVDEEAVSVDQAVADGVSFSQAVEEMARTRSIQVIVSAQTSSALTPRAPLTEREEAKLVEADVIAALGGDPAILESRVNDLWRRGGSCSPGTLAAYGRLFAGRASEVVAYQYPFGVGYAVAVVT
jgi:hypothetical protein